MKYDDRDRRDDEDELDELLEENFWNAPTDKFEYVFFGVLVAIMILMMLC